MEDSNIQFKSWYGVTSKINIIRSPQVYWGALFVTIGYSWDIVAENALTHFLLFFSFLSDMVLFPWQYFFSKTNNLWKWKWNYCLMLIKSNYRIACMLNIIHFLDPSFFVNRYRVDIRFEILWAVTAVHVMYANMSELSSFLLTPHSLPSGE